MLGKLIKYEFKATGRILAPLYGAVIIFSIFSAFFMELNSKYLSIPQSLAIFLYVLLIIATFVLTFFIIIQRFYKNLLSDEGYLMFTIPVKVQDNIIAKLITSFCWTICSVIVALASVFILAFTSIPFDVIPNLFKDMHNAIITLGGNYGYPIIIILFLVLLVSTISQILMLFCSISVGQLFTNHKLLGSFVSYIGIYFIVQSVMTVCMVTAATIIDKTMLLDTFVPSAQFVFILSIILLIVPIILSTIYLLATKFVLSKKLNLQ